MEKNKKPQIRFKGFTDDWEQHKFEEVFNYERPDKYIVKSDKYEDNELTPVLTANKAFILGYTSEKNTYNKTDASIIFDDFTLDSKYVDFHYMVKSSAIKILTLKDMKKDNLRFNYELLNITKFNMMGHARHYISVVQPTLMMSTNKEEQDKISNFMKKIDNLITLYQCKYNKLKDIKASLLEKMFPKDNKKVPEIRFKGFTNTWEQRKLGEISNIVMGQSPDGVNYTDNPTDNILIQGNADLDNGKVVPRIWTTQITKTTKPNDIIFTVRAPVGEVAKSTYKAVIGRGVASLSGNDFLYQTLKKMKEFNYWDKLSAGSTFDSINSEQLKNSEICIPSNEEQKQIGEFFTKVDNLITLHQSKLEKLKELKQSLLNKMFI